MVETVTVTIEADGDRDEVVLPRELLQRISEPDEPVAEVVADVALMSFTGRAHALRHHVEGSAGGELAAVESDLMERFESRFGMSYEEATGHSH